MQRSYKALLAAAAVSGALLAGFAAFGGKSEHVPPPSATPALEFTESDLHVVAPQVVERSLPLTGTLSPMIQATLRAKVAGELVEMATREGEAVRQGQVLARIDQTEVKARVAAREADVEAARANMVWADKNRRTQAALLEKRFISQNAFDNIQSSYDVAVAKLRAAQADLVVARKSLGDSVLTAPFAGVVAERHAKPGERVALDAKVVTLVDLSRLELEAAVPAADIAKVRVGQPVGFRVDGFGTRRFEGRIERINPATAAGSRSINVYAVIENSEGALRSGMFAQGSATLEQVAGGILIPAAAVREEAGQTFVYAIVSGVLKRAQVRLGSADSAGQVQVLDGLAPGDRIVRSNLGTLREGAVARLSGPQAQ